MSTYRIWFSSRWMLLRGSPVPSFALQPRDTASLCTNKVSTILYAQEDVLSRLQARRHAFEVPCHATHPRIRRQVVEDFDQKAWLLRKARVTSVVCA